MVRALFPTSYFLSKISDQLNYTASKPINSNKRKILHKTKRRFELVTVLNPLTHTHNTCIGKDVEILVIL